MTLAEFQDLRADIAHGLLENGIFYRLGATQALLESPNTVRQRANQLARVTQALLRVERANVALAAKTWLEGDAERGSVEKEILALVTHAGSLEGMAPHQRFPDRAATLAQIQRGSDRIRAITGLFGQPEHLQLRPLEDFWGDALAVYDLVRAMRKGSPQFWEIFRSTQA